MIFSQIPQGSSVFVDANTLVYHFAPDSTFGIACTQLLERIWCQDIFGFTSTHVMTDVAHRLMTMGAITLFSWPRSGITNRLKRHPLEIQKLSQFRRVVDNFNNSKIQILSVAPDLLSDAARASQQHGLFTGDALIVAVMQQHGFTNLASNDADFDRVAGVTRFGPV